MRYTAASLLLIFLLALATAAVAQNGLYDVYYSFTSTPNPDGSATITTTAEINGIDDAGDWIEGQYQPMCTVQPKIQLTGDANWVAGTTVTLGHEVDQVRTGQPQYIPADGSEVSVNLAVEALVRCNGAPNPGYYLYPNVANLPLWSPIDPNSWFLVGFEPAQTQPPYWSRYCTSGYVCPPSGVASIKNYVDFAAFLAVKIALYANNYAYNDVYQGTCSYKLSCPNGNQHASCPLPDPETIEAPCAYPFLIGEGIYVKNFLGFKSCFGVGILTESSVPINCQ